jgi:NurA-like 5'-3' nuclease
MDFTIDKDEDISIIMAAALRYSLGRSSYFVHTVQEFLRRHKENEFIKRDTQLYIEAIQSHLIENDTDECSIRWAWEDLLKALES